MKTMTNAEDREKTQPVPDPGATESDVAQLFGKCILRFQAFELLMKAMVAQHRVSGSTSQPKDAPTRHVADTQRKTMGALVGDMMTSFLVPEGQEGQRHETPELSGCSFTSLQQIVLPPDEFARIEAEHRDLVALRNFLVHHFLEDHDLRSEAGRHGAREALVAALDRVTRAYNDLSALALETAAARQALADLLASPEMRDWIASGRPPWPHTTIVQALHDASTALAACDWTSVDAAADWIAAHYPDESPRDYGCRTWPQVIHDSGLFELQRRKAEGRQHAWYRPTVQKPVPN